MSKKDKNNKTQRENTKNKPVHRATITILIMIIILSLKIDAIIEK
jgi:hypothetical protein